MPSKRKWKRAFKRMQRIAYATREHSRDCDDQAARDYATIVHLRRLLSGWLARDPIGPLADETREVLGDAYGGFQAAIGEAAATGNGRRRPECLSG